MTLTLGWGRTCSMSWDSVLWEFSRENSTLETGVQQRNCTCDSASDSGTLGFWIKSSTKNKTNTQRSSHAWKLYRSARQARERLGPHPVPIQISEEAATSLSELSTDYSWGWHTAACEPNLALFQFCKRGFPGTHSACCPSTAAFVEQHGWRLQHRLKYFTLWSKSLPAVGYKTQLEGRPTEGRALLPGKASTPGTGIEGLQPRHESTLKLQQSCRYHTQPQAIGMIRKAGFK